MAGELGPDPAGEVEVPSVVERGAIKNLAMPIRYQRRMGSVARGRVRIDRRRVRYAPERLPGHVYRSISLHSWVLVALAGILSWGALARLA